MSPWPPSTKAWVSSTDTPSSSAMNVRKRAESSTPAMPRTRSRGKPEAPQRDVAHRVERVGDDDQDRVRRVLHRLLDDGADDPGVLGQEVVAAHPGLARQAGGHDDDVGAGRVGVVVRAGDPGVVADDRGRLGEVEALALRQALDDVDEHDVRQAGLGDALRGRGADVAGADDGDLVAGHAEWSSFRSVGRPGIVGLGGWMVVLRGVPDGRPSMVAGVEAPTLGPSATATGVDRWQPSSHRSCSSSWAPP